MNPPVVKQEIWFAIRTDGVKGAGTQADPYNAAGTDTDSDPRFDQMMRTIGATISLSAPMTIRLQPGIYYTNGFNALYAEIDPMPGWLPKSGMRIVGSGIGVTKLILVKQNLQEERLTAVIGTDDEDPAQFLEGFEVSDLTVDGNLSNNLGTSVTIGGISVSGKNIFVCRVEVRNIGGKGTFSNRTAIGVSLAMAWLSQSEPYNNVIDRCVVKEPHAVTSLGLIGLQFASGEVGAYHKFCVIRDCNVDLMLIGASTVDFTKNCVGIAAGGGIATIVENNQVRNCQNGLGISSPAVSKDTVFRDNTFQNVAKILVEESSSAVGFERLILLNNTAEWPTPGGSAGQFNAPIGLILAKTSSSSTTIFKSVIAGGNIFRRPVGNTPSNSEIGLSFKNCTNVIVENNVADVGTSPNNAVSYSVCGTVKAFNNKKPDGTFVAAYDTSSALHLGELTTDVEDALLAI